MLSSSLNPASLIVRRFPRLHVLVTGAHNWGLPTKFKHVYKIHEIFSSAVLQSYVKDICCRSEQSRLNGQLAKNESGTGSVSIKGEQRIWTRKNSGTRPKDPSQFKDREPKGEKKSPIHPSFCDNLRVKSREKVWKRFFILRRISYARVTLVNWDVNWFAKLVDVNQNAADFQSLSNWLIPYQNVKDLICQWLIFQLFHWSCPKI